MMLVCCNLKLDKAQEYYVHSYSPDGKWHGQGASELALSGIIASPQPYFNLLEGFHPNGRDYLTGKRVSPLKRRAASDFVFSTPKSVSLQALVYGDEQLREAHRQAVNSAIALLETYSQSRICQKGRSQVVDTGNLIVACFEHIESRGVLLKDIPLEKQYLFAENPHLHTHCVVMNLTQLADGRWRSLHNQQMYAYQKKVRERYERTLAERAQQLGYQIRYKQGSDFDLAMYPQAAIEAFSQRRRVIDRLGAKSESSSWEAKSQIWLKTRCCKENKSDSELMTQWQQKRQAVNLDGLLAQLRKERLNKLASQSLVNQRYEGRARPDSEPQNSPSILHFSPELPEL